MQSIQSTDVFTCLCQSEVVNKIRENFNCSASLGKPLISSNRWSKYAFICSEQICHTLSFTLIYGLPMPRMKYGEASIHTVG